MSLANSNAFWGCSDAKNGPPPWSMNRRSQQSAGFSQGTPQWNMKQHMRRLNKMHKVHHLLLSCLNHSQWTLRRIQVSVYIYIYTYKYLLLIYLYHNLVYHSLWSLCQETNCFIAVLKLGRPLATSSIHDLKANRQRRIVPLRSTRSLLSSPHDAKACSQSIPEKFKWFDHARSMDQGFGSVLTCFICSYCR